MMVMNTVLSVMAYDYPTEKLSVYLSDDGGSELTYYALMEAAEFAKQWIPYCKKYSVEPRSPSAYFVSIDSDAVDCDDNKANDLAVIKKSYKHMETEVENAVKLGYISDEVRSKQKGFSQWDSHSSKRDHDTYLQVVIDGRDPNAIDVEGIVLPTLVYLAREKRPQYHHNYKAGSMNALIRVSSNISNGKVILNVDCDMYSNNSMAIRDALCCLMDEEKGHEVAFVQFPQNFENLTKNELYIPFMRTISEVGVKYGCAVEDVFTGLSIQCHGWKSVYLNPTRKAFLGVAPTTLLQMLVQQKRWSEGGSALGWWNDQRMWLYKRSSSYIFSFIDTMLYLLGYSDSAFVITAKTSDEDESQRYEKEILEFGASSPLFTVLATLAVLNLYCFAGFVKEAISLGSQGIAEVYDTMALQILLCGILILINLPLYQALYIRKDKGKLPSSIALKSMAMQIGFSSCAAIILLAFLLSLQGAFSIRFVIDRDECFSHNVLYEGDTVHLSFVVIKVDASWHYTQDGVDLVVKGPSGEQIHELRDKTSEKYEFVTRHKGIHQFCFTNKSPYHETIDFDIHVSHFTYYDQHAKDEHFNPLLEQISKLEEALYNIQFEQHWLEAQTERQAIVNEAMSRRAIHKAFFESAGLVGASVLQVYLLRRLFERKLGMSRV
ncbi:hypothetical protein ACLB2K_030419 [Fragaria x ananassa]